MTSTRSVRSRAKDPHSHTHWSVQGVVAGCTRNRGSPWRAQTHARVTRAAMGPGQGEAMRTWRAQTHSVTRAAMGPGEEAKVWRQVSLMNVKPWIVILPFQSQKAENGHAAVPTGVSTERWSPDSSLCCLVRAPPFLKSCVASSEASPSLSTLGHSPSLPKHLNVS